MERRNARCWRLVWFAAMVCLWPLAGANVAQAGPYNSQGIVSYWTADVTANDIFGRNNGTPSGGVTYAPGVAGQAFSFDGTGSVNGPVHGAQSSSLDVGQVTVAFWMKGASGNPMTCCQGLVTTDFYGVEISPGNVGSTQDGVNFFVSTDTGGSWHLTSDAVNAAYPVASNTWYYIAATYDGSTLRLYANGVLVRSTPWSGSISTMGTTSFLSIGSEDGRKSSSAGNVAGRYFAGQIDEVQIYNRALSDSEIQSLYARYTAPWVPRLPEGATPPPARLNNTATYDSQNNRLLVFGGSFTAGGGVDRHNDLWAYQFSTGSWSNLSPDTYPNVPASGPAGRTNHTATWATTPQHQNDRLLVFGGCADFIGGCPYNDLWSYQTSTGWQPLMPPAGNAPPPVRQWHAAVWDSNWQSTLGGNAGRLLVFGGSNGQYPNACGLNDLWSYSYSLVDSAWEWTQLSPSPSTASSSGPAPRTLPGAAWDSSYSQNGAHGRLLIFGGNSCGTLQNDLWQWTDAGGWQQLQAPGTGPGTVPAPRVPDGTIWDSDTASLLVFGGGGAGGVLNDAWRYTASGWAQISQGLFPPSRLVGGVDTDGQGNLFVFGGMLAPVAAGVPGQPSNDFWQLDTGGPTTTATANPAANANHWNNTNVTVTLNAMDNQNGSGVSATYYAIDNANCSPASLGACSTYVSSTPFTVSGQGPHTVTYFSVDNAGNVEAAKTLTVQIDTTLPTVSCGSADGIWHGSNVTIACTAAAPVSGLASQSDAAFSLSTSVPAGTETASASTNSRQVCNQAGGCVMAGPIAGNKIDRKAPAISGSATLFTGGVSGGPYIPGTWTNQSVMVTFSCSDGGSGLAPGSPPAPTMVSTENTNPTTAQSVSGSCQDNVGNTAGASFGGIYIDKTKPSLTPAVSPNPVYLNGAATASPNATDSLSGIDASRTGCPSVPTGAVGSLLVTCTATDNAGNSQTASATYIVTYKIKLLYNTAEISPPAVTLQLLDANTVNKSASNVIVTAPCIVPHGAPDCTSAVKQINPPNGSPFTFAPIGTSGPFYLFKLPSGLSQSAQYDLLFKATNDPVMHAAMFTL